MNIRKKKRVIQEIDNLMETYDPSAQGNTWNNPSMKIQCRLHYFLLSKEVRSSLKAIKIVPNVCRKEIMYDILNNWSSCSALNHLIPIGKYLIYCQAINRVNFLFADFKALLHQKIVTEKYILFSSNKCSTFYEKWARFLN